MNIFILDETPSEAAKMQCDVHVRKMAVESAQMLSTAHRVLDGNMVYKKGKKNQNLKTWVLDDERENILYKSAHVNHPCSVWVRESAENYYWLLSHMKSLCDEFYYRFNKSHKSESLLGILSNLPKELDDYAMDYPLPKNYAVAISEEIYPGVKAMSDDPVVRYREYYRRKNAEQFEMKWTKREQPEWMK